MKKVVRNNINNLPYSLHDGVVIGFEITGDNLVMKFQHGFLRTVEPFEQINGSIEIQKIDWDFSFVYLLDYQDVICGNVGSFTGKKIELKIFINQFKNAEFNLIDETYGYNTSKFDGYLSDGDMFWECMIEIYHLGDMNYLVEM
jgi:hypothetical protein